MSIAGGLGRFARRPIDPDTPPHLRWDGVLLVLVGGSAGTAARYGLAQVWPTDPGRWPWGTFTANMIAAFALGVLLEALARSGPDVGLRQRIRVCAGTGFCGGLSTYSTFATEAFLLAHDHDGGLALGYLAGTVAAGLLLVVLGTAIAAARYRSVAS